MAAAVVPLIMGLAPSIINLIVGLVHKAAPQAEAANGPNTGPVKFAQVLQAVQNGLGQAAQAGQISNTPAPETVQAIIQAVVTSMQQSGLLGSDAAATPQTAGSIVLKAGQSVTISVGS